MKEIKLFKSYETIPKNFTGVVSVNNGRKIWLKDGKISRIDGPAVIWPDGIEQYFVDNKKYSYEDWYRKFGNA